MMPKITAFNGEEHRAFTMNGGSPAALLIHGFPGTPDEMRPLAESLNRAGWTTQALLLPGFGAEMETLADKHYTDWLTAVNHALIKLQAHHNPVIVVGNSMGGALAVSAAAQHPPDGVVLLAPFYTLKHALWEALPMLKYVIPTFKIFQVFKPNFSDPETRKGIHNFMPDADLDDPETQQSIRDFAVPVKLFDHIRTAGKRAYANAPQITCPALVIQGTRDELVRAELTHQLMNRLKGDVRYIEVPAEHDLVRADRPAWGQVEAAVLAFAESRIAERTP